jgi:hypothetical protein
VSDLGLDEILAKISAVTGSRRPDGMILSGTSTGGVYPQPQAHDQYRAPAAPMREDIYTYNKPNVRTSVDTFVAVCDIYIYCVIFTLCKGRFMRWLASDTLCVCVHMHVCGIFNMHVG